MKKTLLKTLLSTTMFFAVSGQMMAQEYTIGNTFAGFPLDSYPIYTYYECSASEFLYSQEDLEAMPAGTISDLSFAFYGGSYLPTHISIWLQNTDDTEITSEDFTDAGTMTKVYENLDLIMEAAEGSNREPAWLKFEFGTPFEYTGGGIRVMVRSISKYYGDPSYQFVNDLNKITDMTAGYKTNARLKYGYTEDGMAYTSVNAVFPIVRFTLDAQSDGGQPDGIQQVYGENHSETYDLQGRKLTQLQHGIYISNGKKVIR